MESKMIVTKLKKNLFFTRCDYCENECKDFHYDKFERVIEGGKIKDKNHQRICQGCKDEHFPDKISGKESNGQQERLL